MHDQQVDDAALGYWDRAGQQGYGAAMFSNAAVEERVRGRLWRIVMDIADNLGVPADGQVLDLGCGDGAFSNQVLGHRYRRVHGIDVSPTAISRANAEAPGEHVTFSAEDLTTFDLDSLPQYDAVFLFGILHHIKASTPSVLKALRKRTSRLIIQEPNGNNPIRKLLELTPTYKAAGEDSFRKGEFASILKAAGWTITAHHRVNIFPNQTPPSVFNLLLRLEPLIESHTLLSWLCTADLYGLSVA